MKKRIALLLIILISITSISQTVTLGAEHETIPILGDTIRDFYDGTDQMKRLKFRDGEKLTITEFNELGRISTR